MNMMNISTKKSTGSRKSEAGHKRKEEVQSKEKVDEGMDDDATPLPPGAGSGIRKKY